MWSPFKKRSRANVHNLVVKNDQTGLNELHFIITVDALGDAKDAISESFEAAVSSERSNPDFGGDVVFVVYGPSAAGSELSPELADARAQLEAKIAASGLKTAADRPFRVKIQQKQSMF